MALRAAAAACARVAGSGARRLAGGARRWLGIFAVALGLFGVRFLVPVPVAQADNRDGARLMCGLGVGPVTGGHAQFFRYAFFEYVPRRSCAGRAPYPSSELVPLELARLLTPVFGLPGRINLVALGLVMCALASAGIASLATGLRVGLGAQLLVAAIAWLIMADAAFFDVLAGPLSEPAALVGLMLVAAGVVYLGRGWRTSRVGLALAGSGGLLAILSKEQYLILAVPVCLTLLLASAEPGSWRDLSRFRTRQAGAAVAVAALLAGLASTFVTWDYTSHYGRRLQNIQAVDTIFADIVTRRATAPPELRALGLPASWARYAGRYYWHPGSVRNDPLYHRYAGRLTDSNIAQYLLTHPGSIVSIGQRSADQAENFRVTTLGDYPASAGHPAGATESRVAALTWLMHRLPRGLGLWWYIPLWAAMLVAAIFALSRRRERAWHRDGAILVLCMTGCAVAAFIPPAYLEGVSITRHMVGANLATALAFPMSIALAVSVTHQGLADRARRRRAPDSAPAPAELARPR